MRTLFSACLLCVLAAAAGAQHVAPNAPSTADTAAPAAAANPTATATARAATASGRPTVELIKAAGAATPGEQALPSAARSHPSDRDDRHTPSGLAMLLVGLAVMLGIALRRFTSRG
ncbi:hypothetical protein [Caenimonas aquaedulcis]|uniref:LPXTG cell wall anchor domain-containing protein n=1 Tax=Caenimonas aquaedulcis TaxID=2793270 RepID=A0A931H855_9BURK|nr:hypothetical protein [Caenimonas aquaedulcis]MBG9390113.1 hypothetical protein [Caenimonas aquaedulcis]